MSWNSIYVSFYVIVYQDVGKMGNECQNFIGKQTIKGLRDDDAELFDTIYNCEIER